MRIIPGILLSLPFAWALSGCEGSPTASGYYFMVMTVALSGSSTGQTEAQCIFRVNPDDEGKSQ